jgi:hypothetical protein
VRAWLPCALACLLAPAALAQTAAPASGRALLTLCQSARPAEVRSCAETIRKAADRFQQEIAASGQAPWFCPPEDGDAKALPRLYAEWAADNPDQLDQPAAEAIRAALQEAFPCAE